MEIKLKGRQLWVLCVLLMLSLVFMLWLWLKPIAALDQASQVAKAVGADDLSRGLSEQAEKSQKIADMEEVLGGPVLSVVVKNEYAKDAAYYYLSLVPEGTDCKISPNGDGTTTLYGHAYAIQLVQANTTDGVFTDPLQQEESIISGPPDQ